MRRALLLLALAPVAAGTQEQGAALFATHCASCHATSAQAPPGPGPRLRGVLGRTVAGDAGFDYSPALQAARRDGLAWDRDRLARFLADPEEEFPGTWMGNRLRDARDIAAVVEHLAQGNSSSAPD